ncbi:hypothetical protein [Corynebacterium heidelbergense]|uniref:Uncharacterized protein n=1 Tax=Corynebacterium heidelbergense TaxID=2055947 RepID=A0A364VA50_9CORY|nr:hypothetical protein [Corynebacterium heidelbergense]RAV33540.1 hypothetical protein CWC39_08005 [Corynebacterium heidelbergense]WCZ36176.1 hypothetical protein CHEID_03080 [Corynebacterium heidelbergense]WCZ37631.1 hypothetical protein CHEID_10570 [Corynebacterium heidelbergense]
MTTKKMTRRRADTSETTGTVISCPRCEQRTLETSDYAAWRWLALHLRRYHGDLHAASSAARHARRLAATD